MSWVIINVILLSADWPFGPTHPWGKICRRSITPRNCSAVWGGTVL